MLKFDGNIGKDASQTFQQLSSTLHFRDIYLLCKGDWNNLQHIKCVVKSTISFKALSKVHSILSYTLHCFVKVMYVSLIFSVNML